VATLKEVAQRAEVSTATVSKVLSNTPYVSEETRARVMRAVEELGYLPNLAARALSKGRTYIIGVVFPYNFDLLFADPLQLTIVEGIESVCIENGYNMLLSTPHVPVNQSVQYRRLVQSGYLDGVITLETMPDIPASALLEQFKYPWIAIGYMSALGTTNTLHSADFSGAQKIAALLIGLGHRQLGIIGVVNSALMAATYRIAGYRAAFEEAGLNFASVPQAQGNFSVESGYEAADALLKAAPHLTAILCLNDRMAMGAIQRVRADGLRVPEDMSVVGFDDIPSAAFFTPPLTTVRQFAREMGVQASQMLFELIEQRGNRKQESDKRFDPVTFPTELVIRGSATTPPRCKILNS
jgi:DNA-binding LacI/PurR family transcriptional regulator